jgi:hypothetical protein
LNAPRITRVTCRGLPGQNSCQLQLHHILQCNSIKPRKAATGRAWNVTHINSTNASHTKQFIPTVPHRLSLSLWPNFTLTQFLTNHGQFRSYLHKMKKTSSPTCKCPERAVQMARHCMTECSLFLRNHPAVLHSLPTHPILKHHIHTVSVSSYLSSILHSLLELLEGNLAVQQLHNNNMSITDHNM